MTGTTLPTPRKPPYDGGFTLVEVMVTIIVLGVLASIAIPSWWSVVEGRRVESATNQVAADLRLAHSSAINRLAQWQVVVPAADSATYQIGPVGGPLVTRTLADGADGTQIATATTITFNGDGSATLPGGASTAAITVQATDGTPSQTIQVTKATSGIRVD